MRILTESVQSGPSLMLMGQLKLLYSRRSVKQALHAAMCAAEQDLARLRPPAIDDRNLVIFGVLVVTLAFPEIVAALLALC